MSLIQLIGLVETWSSTFKPGPESEHFISLPTQETHQPHPVGPGVARLLRKCTQKVADKICELVSEGTTQVPEIKRILRNYAVPINHVTELHVFNWLAFELFVPSQVQLPQIDHELFTRLCSTLLMYCRYTTTRSESTT